MTAAWWLALAAVLAFAAWVMCKTGGDADDGMERLMESFGERGEW